MCFYKRELVGPGDFGRPRREIPHELRVLCGACIVDPARLERGAIRQDDKLWAIHLGGWCEEFLRWQ